MAGMKQSGAPLNDVVLPPWAKGDAREFIRAHREVDRLVSCSLYTCTSRELCESELAPKLCLFDCKSLLSWPNFFLFYRLHYMPCLASQSEASSAQRASYARASMPDALVSRRHRDGKWRGGMMFTSSGIAMCYVLPVL